MLQRRFRVFSEWVQSRFRLVVKIVVIAASSASSVSFFGFSLGKLSLYIWLGCWREGVVLLVARNWNFA